MKSIKIEEITKVKNEEYNIKFSDNNNLTLSANTILEFRLTSGKIIDIKLLEEIHDKEEFNKAYSRALSYSLKYNPTKQKMLVYLKKHKVDLNISNLIIEQLINKKIINEELMLKNSIDSLINKGYGINHIIPYLKNNGYNEEDIKKHIYNIDEENYLESLRKIAYKKYKLLKKDEYSKRKTKLNSYLVYRGYEFELINDIIKEILLNEEQ